MRSYLIAAGIPKNQIRLRDGNHKIDTYLKAFDWLHDLSMNAHYLGHVYAYNLVKPEIWKNYKTLNITGLREQKLLEVSSKKVRVLWKSKRPQVFGSKKKR